MAEVDASKRRTAYITFLPRGKKGKQFWAARRPLEGRKKQVLVSMNVGKEEGFSTREK